jgi:hypothetical protein
MKKIIILSTLMLSVFCVKAQDTEPVESTNFNEIKLNGLMLVAGAFEVAYERTLNEESALGVSIFLPIDNDIDLNYYISPYYRFYFGNKYAAGFFVEGFAMLNSYEDEVYYLNDFDFFTVKRENITDFALGIGLGGKWITNSGFVAEIGLGVGRNLFNSDDNDFEAVAKLQISLGYRF